MFIVESAATLLKISHYLNSNLELRLLEIMSALGRFSGYDYVITHYGQISL